MNRISESISALVLAFVILGWIVFAVGFLHYRKPSQTPERKRDRASIAGIALQGLAYALVWSVRRPLFAPLVMGNMTLNVGLAAVTVALTVGSIWVTIAAVRVLGKQWSLAARLLEEHVLITEGPYQIVRNPIYTGMLGMLIATGLAVSHWAALVVAVVIYLAGTIVRMRSEEKLLQEEFGRVYEKYVGEVPALIPLWRRF